MGGNQDELQFNVGEDEEETTVVMNQDGGDASIVKKEELIVEQEKETAAKTSQEDAPDSEDLDNYSQKVQKRIDKLTARLREHQRREEAALEYARSIQKSNEELQQRYNQSNVARMGEARGRLDTQIVALKSVIKKAREEHDIDTETEAQQRLTTALWEQQRLLETERQAREQPVAPVQPQQQPKQPQPPRAAADPRAEEWAEKNEWFGKDIVMTNTVRGIHVELVKNEGFDPSSDEYYDEIDRRMRSLFPQRFQGSQTAREDAAPQPNRGSRPASTVAPATRSSGVNSTARRMIKLKPSEVAIAKKLGVPLEEYAKYVKR
jgi:hypothetical protein